MTAQTTQIMIKRVTLMSLITAFLLLATISMAQEKQATKSASPSAKTASASAAVDEEKVKALKDKLATKVAELRQNQKRGFFGEVAAVAKSSFTLVTDKGEVRVHFTEDTLFFKLGKDKTAAKVEDVKNGLSASVLGLYDEENKQENAKVVLLQTGTKFFVGEITDINKVAGSITLKNKKAETQIFDYEKTTTADEVTTLSKKMTKSGLSRLAIGDRLLIWGTPSEDDSKKTSIVRLLRIPKEIIVPVDQNSASATPSASLSASPKASPSPSIKASPKVSSKPSPSASPKS
jgi:hypothetical protein